MFSFLVSKIELIPTLIAFLISSSYKPSITISNTLLTLLFSFVFTSPFNPGQYSKLVDAIKFLYFDPTFDPDLTIPPEMEELHFYLIYF